MGTFDTENLHTELVKKSQHRNSSHIGPWALVFRRKQPFAETWLPYLAEEHILWTLSAAVHFHTHVLRGDVL